jgi:hypothetical protein
LDFTFCYHPLVDQSLGRLVETILLGLLDTIQE